MNEKILEEIGLTQGETKVYLAMLKIGSSTIGKITKQSGVSNSKIYDILDRLSKKGLVGTVVINGRNHFEAKDPSRLKEFIEIKEKEIKEKEKKVNEIIPILQKIKDFAEPTQEAEILQGIKGIKTFTEMILNKLEKGDTFYILGAPKESNELMGGYFQGWHERRHKKEVKCKILYNQDSNEWAKKRKKTPLTEVRFLPENVKTPVLVDIGKDYVATIIFAENPLCIVINNKRVAESYLNYFQLLWEMARK